MSNTMITMGYGMSKFAEDVTNAAQPITELCLYLAFEHSLHTAAAAFLS